jgi:flagellar basal body-associated protein FliL
MDPVNPKAALRKSGGRKWLLLALATVGVAAGCSYFLYARNLKQHSAPEVRRPYGIVHLDPFVANLADDGQQAFLKIGIAKFSK